MVATLFLAFLALMLVAVVALTARYISVPAALGLLATLSVWFLYVGLLGYFGVLRNPTLRPSPILYILGPVLVFLLVFIVRSGSSRLALAFPVWIILATQTFRVGVELFLHQLWIAGVIPRMLTFAGANVDIYVGATAPVIAWLSTRGRLGLKVAFLWNILGLFALANIVTRTILTSPGPFNLIRAEVPNRMLGTFPFTLIPGFFVPLAVILHVLAIRAINSRLTQLPTPWTVVSKANAHGQCGTANSSPQQRK